MTQIDFYTRVGDRLHTACRIAAKARARGLQVTLFCPDRDAASRLDRMLWSHPPTGFLPHCTRDHRLAAVTPVILDPVLDDPLHDELLINLHDEWPAAFSRFQRLAEIVTAGEDDRERARRRYRFYRERGYEIRTHDLSTV